LETAFKCAICLKLHLLNRFHSAVLLCVLRFFQWIALP
jgi:hypothetical protein